jgi:hypothetical protein
MQSEQKWRGAGLYFASRPPRGRLTTASTSSTIRPSVARKARFVCFYAGIAALLGAGAVLTARWLRLARAVV